LTAPKSIHDLNSDLFTPEEDERYGSPVEARKKAMDYLARREYGQSELVRKLIGAGYESDVAAAAVERLTAEGLQDDRRFVDNFIQSRVSQGKGPIRIQVDLGQKGIPSELVDDVLDSCEVDWFELAGIVRRKKFGADLPREFRLKAKQMRFLQYRGFEQVHILSAMAVKESF